jgi:hypothetical protein
MSSPGRSRKGGNIHGTWPSRTMSTTSRSETRASLPTCLLPPDTHHASQLHEAFEGKRFRAGGR